MSRTAVAAPTRLIDRDLGDGAITLDAFPDGQYLFQVNSERIVLTGTQTDVLVEAFIRVGRDEGRFTDSLIAEVRARGYAVSDPHDGD